MKLNEVYSFYNDVTNIWDFTFQNLSSLRLSNWWKSAKNLQAPFQSLRNSLVTARALKTVNNLEGSFQAFEMCIKNFLEKTTRYVRHLQKILRSSLEGFRHKDSLRNQEGNTMY